jgi:4-hydroxybutyrate CoA-transferase
MESLFKSGQRVFVAGSSNEPTALVRTLAETELPDGLTFIQFPLPGYNDTDFTALNATAEQITFFMTPALRGADPLRLHYLPMQMRAVFDYLSSDVDVVLLQVARDREGVLRVGPNVDFVDAALASASVVVAELNEAIVAPAGAPRINEAQLDHIEVSSRPLPEMAPPVIDDAADAIGRLVAGLVRDGDCIQTGIGAIPAAILKMLGDKNDLGMHGGLIDDGGMALIDSGVLNGARKAIDNGLHVVGMGLGTHALLDWLSDRPDVVFRGANHTHEVGVIRQLDNFVSVNSAVEIDLYGQVNAEFAGGRQISGTGGSVDFMRAARASKGGRSIVAMNATARGGSVSRIVDKVEMVTALRTDVDTVVTEYGVADIKHLPNRARAEALIAIAAPEFRDELRQNL